MSFVIHIRAADEGGGDAGGNLGPDGGTFGALPKPVGLPMSQ